MDVKWFAGDAADFVLFDMGNKRVQFDDVDLYLGDNDILAFGDGPDTQMSFDASDFNVSTTGGTNIDTTGALALNSSAGAINIGNDAVAQAINIGTGAAARTITIGNTTGATGLVFDSGTNGHTFNLIDNDPAALNMTEGANAYITIQTTDGAEKVRIRENASLGDTIKLMFGTGDDITMAFDGTNLEMLPAVDDTGAFHIGDGTTDMDVKWFAGDAADFVLFDMGNKRVQFDDVDLYLGDNDILAIGDGPDFQIVHDSTDTTMTSSTGDLIIDNTLATGSTINRLGTDTNATDFQVQNNSEGALFTVWGDGKVLSDIPDNTSTAFVVEQGDDDYIAVDTTNNAEAITFGNDTTDPDFVFAGDGAIVFSTGITSGEAITVGDALYMKSDGKLWKTDADALASGQCVAVAAETVGAADLPIKIVALHGMIVTVSTDLSGDTEGDVVYLDTATAGGLTTTAPSGSGDVIFRAGIIYDNGTGAGDGIIFFMPQFVAVNP